MAETRTTAHSYGPGTLADLQRIFDTAWNHLVATNSPFASPDNAAGTRDELARRVICQGLNGVVGDEIMKSVLEDFTASHAEG
jgi:hypothetical protein